MKHILLPRSTGLHYSLRALAPRIPDLRLLDLTVAYPGTSHVPSPTAAHRIGICAGIPALGYGQDYYTLRSVFFDGVAPPAIHMHLRMFDVKTGVPIGDLAGAGAGGGSEPDRRPRRVVEVDIPGEEKDVFDLWLRKLWQEKDDAMDRFFAGGALAPKDSPAPVVEIPLALRRRREVLDAFAFFWPAGVAYLWGRIRG